MTDIFKTPQSTRAPSQLWWFISSWCWRWQYGLYLIILTSQKDALATQLLPSTNGTETFAAGQLCLVVVVVHTCNPSAQEVETGTWTDMICVGRCLFSLCVWVCVCAHRLNEWSELYAFLDYKNLSLVSCWRLLSVPDSFSFSSLAVILFLFHWRHSIFFQPTNTSGALYWNSNKIKNINHAHLTWTLQ